MTKAKELFMKSVFPIQCEVNWDAYRTGLFKLLNSVFLTQTRLYFSLWQKLFEDNHANFNNTPSPRIAIDIT
jgi:hypothetical protein